MVAPRRTTRLANWSRNRAGSNRCRRRGRPPRRGPRAATQPEESSCAQAPRTPSARRCPGRALARARSPWPRGHPRNHHRRLGGPDVNALAPDNVSIGGQALDEERRARLERPDASAGWWSRGEARAGEAPQPPDPAGLRRWPEPWDRAKFLAVPTAKACGDVRGRGKRGDGNARCPPRRRTRLRLGGITVTCDPQSCRPSHEKPDDFLPRRRRALPRRDVTTKTDMATSP